MLPAQSRNQSLNPTIIGSPNQSPNRPVTQSLNARRRSIGLLIVPALPYVVDGSAAPFVFLIQSAGIEEQRALKKYIRVKKPVEVKEGDKWVRFAPYNGLRLTFSIAFDHPAFDHVNREIALDFAETSYVREISRARTFGFMHEVESLRGSGLALGGSLDNAVVMDQFRVLNSDGLRYENEFVRHKVLDAIGDLYLLGHPLIAAFTAHKSGHALNNKLLRALLADQETWEFVTFQRGENAPEGISRQYAQALA